jgi:hypothetical protein
MQYRLWKLVLLTAIGPPVLAVSYWLISWFGAVPQRLMIPLAMVGTAGWVIGPLVWYFELIDMVCGPGLHGRKRRKSRRVVRVRIERYAGGST